MFVAIRDIRAARGRFALMGSVVLLITLLIVLLSGLTAGLAGESTSGIAKLPATHISFGSGNEEAPEQSFADSTVTAEQLDTWSGADGVQWAAPLGITQTRLDAADGTSASASVFGVRPSDPVGPEGVADNSLVVSQQLADEDNLRVGDRVTAGTTELTVSAIAPDAHYSHTPVAWTSLDTWSQVNGPRGGEQPPVATVVAAKLDDNADPAAIDAQAGTSTATRSGSLAAIGSYSSENGSLLMMQGFLYAISALVIGAFLTVWTIQRTGDIAILKALGGSTGYLLRDALVQSLVVLLIGAGLGGAAGIGLGALAVNAVPFELTVTTTVLPVLGMIVLGMAGAALAVRRITSVDPLTALGAVR
ncbi:FtsX-like permease family protein [Allosaccharopolyspora coralli]|uniref:FtsX-like permease family protein n=1 Tax=Allosaccharopolyspora coralli TaxID=2665642 RepID=A0A5Q3Q644_9PSEU|nr:ABC transporter permease [Allosaccharopolyspora coralli]QGK69942.1 FtsX-like permease family protein [Allosaccharopolyspora coralli]